MQPDASNRYEFLSRREFLIASGVAVAGLVAAPYFRGGSAQAEAAVSAGGTVGWDQSPLPYAWDALEPVIDAQTMEIHFGKHHAGYVRNLNAALEAQAALKEKRLEDLLAYLASVPEEIRTKVRNHGGGHYNHAMFWDLMTPGGSSTPNGALAEALDRDLGGWEAFQKAFETAAADRFGSGWAWLVVGPGKKLVVGSTPNQDNPLMQGVSSLVGSPVLGLDVWEHAYYLKYQNRRADYVKAWWQVVNWDKALALYEAAMSA